MRNKSRKAKKKKKQEVDKSCHCFIGVFPFFFHFVLGDDKREEIKSSSDPPQKVQLLVYEPLTSTTRRLSFLFSYFSFLF